MNRKHIISIFLLGSIVLSGGCRKDLCYDHDRHGLTAHALIQPEWEQEWEQELPAEMTEFLEEGGDETW